MYAVCIGGLEDAPTAHNKSGIWLNSVSMESLNFYCLQLRFYYVIEASK